LKNQIPGNEVRKGKKDTFVVSSFFFSGNRFPGRPEAEGLNSDGCCKNGNPYDVF